MRNTQFAEEIDKMTDAELDSQWSSAYHLAYGESFGHDYEATANAIQRYEMLSDELRRRQSASEKAI